MSFKEALLESLNYNDEDSLREQLEEFVEDLNDNDLIALWNDMAISEGYSNNVVYENNEDFFENNFTSPYEAVSACYRGEYSFNDSYVTFDGYANLKSCSDLSEVTDNPTLVDWLVNNVDRAEDYGFDYEEPEEEEDSEEEE